MTRSTRSRPNATPSPDEQFKPISWLDFLSRLLAGSEGVGTTPGLAVGTLMLLLAFGPLLPPGAAQAVHALNLSLRADLVEAAANLFSHLRALDAAGASTIVVMPVPPTDLGEAINDRLTRAAAPR